MGLYNTAFDLLIEAIEKGKPCNRFVMSRTTALDLLQETAPKPKEGGDMFDLYVYNMAAESQSHAYANVMSSDKPQLFNTPLEFDNTLSRGEIHLL